MTDAERKLLLGTIRFYVQFSGAFCVGGDVQSHPATYAKNRQEILQALQKGQELILKLRSLEKPAIVSVNGMALGVGCDLACACDLRIASETATFAEIFIQRGMVPDCGGTYFIPRLVGIGKTFELVLTGEPIDAKEAEKIGLVNKVVSADYLESATKEFALKLATASQMAMQIAKVAVYRAFTIDLASELEAQAQAQAQCLENPYTKELIKAFVEKRKVASQEQ